ncbi:MAG: hypothetical protein QOK02_3580 [Mycobacterium sp.]|nr:hypothetical protein [Mycobacterium sp.]
MHSARTRLWGDRVSWTYLGKVERGRRGLTSSFGLPGMSSGIGVAAWGRPGSQRAVGSSQRVVPSRIGYTVGYDCQVACRGGETPG